MIGIVDYNAGNIKSVERAMISIGAPYIISKKPSELEKADTVIFPGVGEASYAMGQLKKTGFDIFLKDWAQAQKPLFGICLGSQIIFEFSEENDTECLGLLKGKIRHIKNIWEDEAKSGKINSIPDLKVPHMGWNNLTYSNGGSPIFNGVPEHSDFYFVHSYAIQPEDKTIIKASAEFGVQIPSCVSCGSITAFQFHPEKSGKNGLQILKNIAAIDSKNGGAEC